jgi:hypothetical protein
VQHIASKPGGFTTALVRGIIGHGKPPRHQAEGKEKMRHRILAALLALLTYGASATERSPLCDMYDGHTPDDPRYLDEYYRARASPAIDCVQQTAVRLSSGQDAAEIVANAAVLACDKEAVEEAKAESSKGGQSFNVVLAVVKNTMNSSAVLAITTMRAGRCFTK